jgi:type IV pilus assembly protein PilM
MISLPFMPKSKVLFGLDIGSSSIKIAQLGEVKAGYRLEKFGVKTLDPELIVDGTVMDAGRVIDILRELLQELKMKSKDVAISVSGHSVIVKKINIPTMTEEELEESIKWEAEQYIPFDLDDVNVDFHLLGESESPEGQGEMSVLLVAAKKDRITEYTSLVGELGLNPVIVDVDAFAIENMYGINYDIAPDEIAALVNIGASVMNINVLKNGTSTFTRDISVGGNRYTEMIQRELNLGFEDAERAKRLEPVDGVSEDAVLALLNTGNTEIVSEIVRSIDYYRTTSAADNVDKIVLCGGSSMVKGLPELLNERMSIPVEVSDPFSKIQVDPKSFDIEFLKTMGPVAAVVIGLAIRRPGDR